MHLIRAHEQEEHSSNEEQKTHKCSGAEVKEHDPPDFLLTEHIFNCMTVTCHIITQIMFYDIGFQDIGFLKLKSINMT